MLISREQARMFFHLWIPLLDFVNTELQILAPVKTLLTPRGLLPLPAVQKVIDQLWTQRFLIDEYISRNPNHLSSEEINIIAGWKNAISEPFVVLRHLKSGSIFLPLAQPDKAYIVCGITSTWNELLQREPLPTMIETTLLPFCGRIISDGIVIASKVTLVGGAKKEAEEQYRAIKAAGKVFKRWDM